MFDRYEKRPLLYTLFAAGVLTASMATASAAAPAAAGSSTPTRVQTIVISTLVEDGEIVLKSGSSDGRFTVPRGSDVEVVIEDAPGYYIHAVTIGEDGAQSEAWPRDVRAGTSFNGFASVEEEIRIALIPAAAADGGGDDDGDPEPDGPIVILGPDGP